jgi:hypothetical protein
MAGNGLEKKILEAIGDISVSDLATKEPKLVLEYPVNLNYKLEPQWFWRDHYDKLSDVWFASFKDFFRCVKGFVANPDERPPELEKHLSRGALIFSTSLFYERRSLRTKIIHNYGSEREQEPIIVDVDVYQGERLSAVLDEDFGREFMFVLTGSRDKEEIISTFGSDATVYTADFTGSERRKDEKEERVALLSYDGSKFCISAQAKYPNGKGLGIRYADPIKLSESFYSKLKEWVGL